jgi:hypothetical protein
MPRRGLYSISSTVWDLRMASLLVTLIGIQLLEAYNSHRTYILPACSSRIHTSHRRVSLTGVQLSRGIRITGFQILALTAKVTQIVPRTSGPP